jgi:hypothetical protein
MSFSPVIAKDSQTRPACKPMLILAFLLLTLPIRSELIASRTPSAMRHIPRLVLWAWERPEDLRFITPEDTTVAFLAETIHLYADEAAVRPRFQPLLVPDKTKLIAVTRIEAEPYPALNHNQITQSVAAIVKSSSMPRVVAVQVDFDATVSQRVFYRDLLVELRHRLPPALPVSITALASWCLDDEWISGLPIDEAVPMLFRMGVGTNEVMTRMTSGRTFRQPLCQDSLGISSDERWPSLPSGRRLYVFHPRPWTEQTELALLWEVHRWR